VHWLEHNLSNDELAEWWAFYVVEPFGPIREDLRAGRMAAMIANTIPRERGSRPFTAEDFFPELENRDGGGQKSTRSKEEQIAMWKAWAIRAGADVPDPSKNGPATE
jgi:hypothetical protein